LKILRVMAAVLAATLFLGACGDDDETASGDDTTTTADGTTTTEGEGSEFCELSAALDEQDGPPTEEQLVELEAAAPEDIADDMSLIVERYAEVGEAAFEEPEVGQSIGAIESWEAENCPRDPVEAVEPDPDATQISVEADDFSFAIDGDVPAGKVAFIMENVGEEPHELDIVRLNDGTTAEDLEAAAAEGLDAVQALIMDEEIGSTTEAGPGESAVVNVDLEPGVYGAGCFVRSPDGEMHFEKGMRTVFTVA
jgi:hypothetical protein